jgi:hypothetical protein
MDHRWSEPLPLKNGNLMQCHRCQVVRIVSIENAKVVTRWRRQGETELHTEALPPCKRASIVARQVVPPPGQAAGMRRSSVGVGVRSPVPIIHGNRRGERARR